MRLKQYITEATLNKKFIDYLDKNCQPFLKEFGLNYAVKDEFICRGFKKRAVKGFNIIKVRKNRKPRYVPIELHNFLDNLGKELFGWKVRSEGVFTGSQTVAARYTQNIHGISIFIPIGNYKYIYKIKIGDIYSLYDKFNHWDDARIDWEKEKSRPYWMERPEKSMEADKRQKENKKFILDEIEKIYRTKYKTKGLNKHLSDNNSFNSFEAIFKCNEYFAVNLDSKEKLQQILLDLVRSK